MTTLYITQEFAPHFVEGGLGLTSRGLPERLQRDAGLDHEIVLPYYTQLVKDRQLETREIRHLGDIDDSGRAWSAHALLDPSTTLRVTLLRCDEWYDRPSMYRDALYRDFPDQTERAIAFGEATAAYVRQEGRRYDLVHANDWQSGGAARLLAAAGLPVLFNIHSAWYRGELRDPSSTDPDFPANLLEMGLLAAEKVVTCSPGYAAEVASQNDRVGELCRRRGIVGIVSGIDTAVWEASAAGRSHEPFTPATVDTGKAAARKRLALTWQASAHSDAPLIGVCGRFVPEKGADLLIDALTALLASGEAEAVLMGGAEEPFATRLRELAAAHPGRLTYYERFQQDIAWLIYAAADMTVMPSRLEPCGLNQSIALRYGALPLVTPVGGLADTVIDQRSGDPRWNGVWIADPTSEGVIAAVRHLIALIRERPDDVRRARERGMRHPWTWKRTASDFARLYDSLGVRRVPDSPQDHSPTARTLTEGPE